MKKFIIITIVSLTTVTGMLSSKTTFHQSIKPEVFSISPSLSGFKNDLGQAD